MLPGPFRHAQEFRAAFVEGLAGMLSHHELGVFILVLANASFDPEIHGLLQASLRDRFDELAGIYRKLLREGRTPTDAPDDMLVFLKLMAVGFDGLHPTEFRIVGPWRVQFNHLRSFRPPRMSHVAVSGVRRAFRTGGFHFNKNFLQKEVLWEGELLGRRARLLYNKYPFAELHGLLVIDPEAEQPQFLQPDDHTYLWRLTEVLGTTLPGVGFGYNAYGAYCSVNHQHFQMYIRHQLADAGADFPIESPDWRHHGGSLDYPLAVEYFTDAESAWAGIDALHAADRSYNLLYRPGRLYLMPRAMQGSYTHRRFTPGFAWSELAGSITTVNHSDYQSLDDATIRAEFARLRV